jgi:hypothetical protein
LDCCLLRIICCCVCVCVYIIIYNLYFIPQLSILMACGGCFWALHIFKDI